MTIDEQTSSAYDRWTPRAVDRERVRGRIRCHHGPGGVEAGGLCFAGETAVRPVAFLGHSPRQVAPEGFDEVLVELRIGRSRTPLVAVRDGVVEVQFPFFEWERALLSESYFSHAQPLFSRLPLPYTVIPFGVRASLLRLARHAVARRPDALAFPGWPIDVTLDRLRRCIWTAAARLAGVRLQPLAHKSLVLTHDLDEGFGVPGIERLRRVEREVGFRSAFGILSQRYRVEASVLESLVAEGCEVFSHGYLHDGRLPYLPAAELDHRLSHIFTRFPRLREQLRGFRAGQLVRNERLYRHVAQYFRYDLTPSHSERGGPHGPVSGCGTLHPFRGSGGLVHVPLTMPQDYYLIFVEGAGPGRTLAAWEQSLDIIWSEGGVAVMNVHPDNVMRVPWLLDVYRCFLQRAAEKGADVLTPWEVVARAYPTLLESRTPERQLQLK